MPSYCFEVSVENTFCNTRFWNGRSELGYKWGIPYGRRPHLNAERDLIYSSFKAPFRLQADVDSRELQNRQGIFTFSSLFGHTDKRRCQRLLGQHGALSASITCENRQYQALLTSWCFTDIGLQSFLWTTSMLAALSMFSQRPDQMSCMVYICYAPHSSCVIWAHFRLNIIICHTRWSDLLEESDTLTHFESHPKTRFCYFNKATGDRSIEQHWK